jgi:hypothetical protein
MNARFSRTSKLQLVRVHPVPNLISPTLLDPLSELAVPVEILSKTFQWFARLIWPFSVLFAEV